MQKFVGSFLSTVMERRYLWEALQMGPWLFSNKEQQNIKAFFNQPMKLTLSVMMFFQRKYEAAFILYNEMLAPYLPEKITKVGQPIAYVDIATKIMNSLKSFGC